MVLLFCIKKRKSPNAVEADRKRVGRQWYFIIIAYLPGHTSVHPARADRVLAPKREGER